MYKLTLTRQERKAIDWIGGRYFHGDDLYKLFTRPEVNWSMNGEWGWLDDGDITFSIPEHIAWEIREGFEDEEFLFSCLSDEFKVKLLAFCDSIV